MLGSSELVWLLAATAKGDQEAFERLYLATRGILYGTALRLLHKPSLAEEVMQEAYVDIWRQSGSFNPRKGDPVGWMVAILRNLAFEFLRGRRDEGQDGGAASIHVALPEGDELADPAVPEGFRRLVTCLAGLDDESRRILLLAYCNGWSREQLAAKLDQPGEMIADALRDGVLGLRGCLNT